MHFSKEDIKNLDKIYRLNLINSITGIKPANLIGTRDEIGQTNLAIFSSVVHLGSSPSLIGMILRPNTEVRRHTYENILETKSYTINHVRSTLTEQAHFTSAKFTKDESEFQTCGFIEEYIKGFHAPFVAQSEVKIGLKYLESLRIEANQTILIIGEIEHVLVADEALLSSGQIDLAKSNAVGISGLNSYYELKKISDFPYARRSNVPKFEK